jgi:hypothetical protein
LFQDEPDGLIADAWHGRPDIGEAEPYWGVAQDVFADPVLLRSRGLGRGRAIGEDGIGASNPLNHLIGDVFSMFSRFAW